MTVIDDTNVRAAFRDELLDAGLLVRTDVEGLYGRVRRVRGRRRRDRPRGGRGGVVPAGTSSALPSGAAAYGVRAHRLPAPRSPTSPGRSTRSPATTRATPRLLALHESGADWTVELEPSEVVLVPAACHPVYPTLTGTLPDGGDVIDVYSYCFRHEPSADPARMQAFRHARVRARRHSRRRASSTARRGSSAASTCSPRSGSPPRPRSPTTRSSAAPAACSRSTSATRR